MHLILLRDKTAYLTLNSKHLYLSILQISVKLTILIQETPFHCDERMEWMKSAEEHGWIQLQWTSIRGQPECANFPEILWEDVTLPPYPGKYYGRM